jgi:hypothetical protein
MSPSPSFGQICPNEKRRKNVLPVSDLLVVILSGSPEPDCIFHRLGDGALPSGSNRAVANGGQKAL